MENGPLYSRHLEPNVNRERPDFQESKCMHTNIKVTMDNILIIKASSLERYPDFMVSKKIF